MSPTLDAFLRSWPFDPWLLIALGLAAGLYLRGWLALRRRNPRRWHAGQLTAFLGGLTVVYLALASPIEPFAALLLQVHMLQHLLLMMAAPPLLWLGEPLFPFLRGLPQPVRTYWVAPLFRSPALRGFCAADPSGGGAANFCRDHLAVARASGLRTRPALQRLALSPAWLFPWHGTAVLVSRRPAVSKPAALVPLAPVALLDSGGRAEHRPVGSVDVLRPGSVSPLSSSTPTWRTLRPGGSSSGRCPHVGARIPGVSRALVRDRLPTSVRPRTRDEG